MTRQIDNLVRQVIPVSLAFLLFAPGGLVSAQDQQQDQQVQENQQYQAPAPLMAPQQLDDLVAPIALYPDSLVSQVLVASTYPLELVEAGQWLQNNRGLQGSALLDAAKQQNWDPSVQALVVFPEAMRVLTSNVRWTTDLGNAFLAQQADVMSAIQRMRARAQQSGRLNSTPQLNVSTESEEGQNYIQIQPSNPQVVYVPVYNPAYIWGPPAFGYYPSVYYPGVGFGFGFGSGISIGAFFGGGIGWGGWGWGPSWHSHTVVVNNYFFHRNQFNDFHGTGGFRDHEVWQHQADHRLGVPYPNRQLSTQFRGSPGGVERYNGSSYSSNSYNRTGPEQYRAPQPGQRFGNIPGGPVNNGQRFGTAPRVEERPQPTQQRFEGNRSAFSGIQNGGQTRVESDHGYSSMGSQRAPAVSRGGFSGGGRSAAPASRAPSGGGRRR